MQFFENRTAMVTGAGRGVGRAIAEALAAAGSSVILVARSRPELRAVSDHIVASGGHVRIHVADLGTAEGVNETARLFSNVDILVNNAAMVGRIAPTSELSRSEWETLIALNLLAPVGLTSAILPGMIDRSFGRIVNITAGIASNPAAIIGGNRYAASKAALEAHTINLAAEIDGTGVTANAYRPGMVDTAMQQGIREQGSGGAVDSTLAQFRRAHESGELGTAENTASKLLPRLVTNDNGHVWSVTD